MMEVKTQHGLIWPEFDINSENSIKLRKAKSVEDKIVIHFLWRDLRFGLLS